MRVRRFLRFVSGVVAGALTTLPLTGASFAGAGGEYAAEEHRGGPPASYRALVESPVQILAGLAPLPAPGDAASASPGVPAVTLLVDEIVTLADMVGVDLDRAEVERQVAGADLTSDVAGVLSSILAQMRVCTGVTQTVTEHAAADVLPVAGRAELLDCAVNLRSWGQRAEQVLKAERLARRGPGAAQEQQRVVVWPVLSYSPDVSDNRYREDYLLSVDAGGNDRYVNNQGSNQIDLKRSLTSPAARYRAPARGCRSTFPDSTSGRLVRGPDGERQHSMDGPECVPATAFLLDLAGDDRYGRLQRPGYPDIECSRQRSVRRMSTIGVGVEGVGMLVDVAGHDRYLGKTVTMGAGHVGGVGLLEDRGGDDLYLAMRNAQGLGLVAGTGILRDDAGDDRYDFYMPRPLDRDAPLHADGSGGVVDDSGLLSEVGLSAHRPDGIGGRCDGLRRSLQGVGVMGPATGMLVDFGGDDSYRAPGYVNQDSGLPVGALLGSPLVRFAHGSQASGFFGGLGVLWDLAGRDEYVRTDGTRAPNRWDGLLDGPKVDPVPDEEGAPDNGKPLDLSVFYDAE